MGKHKPSVHLTCASCGTRFVRYASQITHSGPRFCSLTCFGVSQRGQLGDPLAARFWQKVAKTKGCWLWTAATDRKGYGRIRASGPRGETANLGAHRVSWELHNGPIPDGMFVCHRCDNPPCVRPDHLFIGDQKANRADCSAKDRTTFGERSGTAKLTERDIRVIRRRYRPYKVTYNDLAADYGVSTGAIQKVVERRSWRRVSD